MVGFAPDTALSEGELKASSDWYPGHRVQQSLFTWIKDKVGSLLGKLTVKADFVAGHETYSESFAPPRLYTVSRGAASVWGALSCLFLTCSPISRQFLRLGWRLKGNAEFSGMLWGLYRDTGCVCECVILGDPFGHHCHLLQDGAAEGGCGAEHWACYEGGGAWP